MTELATNQSNGKKGTACCHQQNPGSCAPSPSQAPVRPEGLVRTFQITGLDCAEEVATLKREIGPLVGGSDGLSFDVLNGRMSVLRDDISSDAIVRAVAKTGMKAEPWIESSKGQGVGLSFRAKYQRPALTAISGLFVLAGFGTDAWLKGGIGLALGSEGVGVADYVAIPARILYGLAILIGGFFVAPKAYFSLKRFRPDMNLLMTVAVLGAVAIGEWFEAATVAFLFSLSLTLESWSVSRARRAVGALMDLTPPFVRVLIDGKEKQLAPDSVPVGSFFIVKPGDRIPLDGVIERGQSTINEATITGESVPATKGPGSQVYAGTMNGDGSLTVKSSKVVSETTLAGIVRMVGEAQSRRASSEQWVEKFAQIYTPIMMVLALLVLLIPPLVIGGQWGDWLYRALVLLVIACPCALVISTPVSVVSSLAAAARNGILIKGGLFAEAPASLKAIALDKTGTLTVGKPEVVDIVPMNGHSTEELIERAASLEVSSTHPLAKAVLDYAQAKNVPIVPAEDYEIVQGKGAQGTYKGEPYWIGSHLFLEEKQEETDDVHTQLESAASKGRTVVVIGNDKHVCGFIAFADQVRPEAKDALSDLRHHGIKEIVMLTGDNLGTARAVAEQLGISEFHAELLPVDKVDRIEQLVKQHGQVAMVGDGINDAPAMARSTLAIAMGAIGSDVAIETADIALMSDDLSKLSWLIAHSRRTLKVIRQNIGFSLAIKATFVILTFTGFSTLWAAIAADMGASLIVVFNGLRLLSFGVRD